MIVFHCDSNKILQAPFKTKADKHCLAAYNSIRGRLKSLSHKVDLQILDNESSTEYKRFITEDWGSRYQLVPPDMHSHNVDERAICTFNAHFLITLARTCAQFPICLWYQILEQAELTLNIMREATYDPRESAWEYLHGRSFNYDTTPLGPQWIPVIMHNKPSRQKSWDYRGCNGFSTDVVLKHYR